MRRSVAVVGAVVALAAAAVAGAVFGPETTDSERTAAVYTCLHSTPPLKDGRFKACVNDAMEGYAPPSVSTTPSVEPSPTLVACSGVQVPPGSSLEAVAASNPKGTTYCLGAGQFPISAEVAFEDGDRIVGVSRTATFIVGTGAENMLSAKSGASVYMAHVDISGGTGDESCNPACGRAIEGTGVKWTLEDIRCHDNANQCVGGGSALIVMRDSECDRNGFGAAFNSNGTTRSAGCIKRASSGQRGLDVRDSFIHDNSWAGLWCDFCSPDTTFTVVNDTITGNGARGVQYEVSGGYGANDYGLVENNVIRNNSFSADNTVRGGISCNSCADLTIRGNIFGGNADGRAVVFVNAKRGPWGDIHNVLVESNTLNGETVNCANVGVTCS